MNTLKEAKAGTMTKPEPIYVEKPYVLLSKENVVLSAGTWEEILNTGWGTDYYNDCIVEARQYDLYMNNNTRIIEPSFWPK